MTGDVVKSRRLLESAIISKTNHIRQHSGFYQFSPYLVNIVLRENNIKIENIKKTFLHSVPLYFWKFFPYHFLIPFLFPLSPRHHIIVRVLWHHIIVNIFHRNKICQNPFPLHISLFFSHQLTRTISTFTKNL